MREWMDPETGVIIQVEDLPWPEFRWLADGGRVTLPVWHWEVVRDCDAVLRPQLCGACGRRADPPEKMIEIDKEDRVVVSYWCRNHFAFSFKSKSGQSGPRGQRGLSYRAASARPDPKP